MSKLKPEIRNAFTDVKVQKHCKDESKTDQSYKELTSINHMVNRLEINDPRALARIHQTNFDGVQVDLSTVEDYQEYLNKVQEAQNSFSNLPSEWRKKFGNNIEEFLQFITNKDNKQELIDAGVMNLTPRSKSSSEAPHGEAVAPNGDGSQAES